MHFPCSGFIPTYLSYHQGSFSWNTAVESVRVRGLQPVRADHAHIVLLRAPGSSCRSEMEKNNIHNDGSFRNAVSSMFIF